MRISAIVPTWNRADLLDRLLRSLDSQLRSFEEVIVVDNGSTDNTRAVAESHGCRLLPLARNQGFAFAVNRGIEAATGDWIAILNNDVTLAPAWLHELLSADAAFACGLILSEADSSRIDGTFDLVTSGGLAWRAGAGELAADPEWQQAREIQFAPMTAALFRRSVFEQVGPLDETFESYLEDVDFGIRCGLAGIRGRYVPSAIATHRGSATLGAWQASTVRLLSRNQMLLIAKHYPQRWVWQYGCSALLQQLMWGWSAATKGQGTAWWRGKREGISAFRRRTPAKESPESVFATSRALLKTLAPNMFWKICAWLG